jgi:hypothetical protein
MFTTPFPSTVTTFKRMHATGDAVTFDAGEHDMQTHTAGEASDTREERSYFDRRCATYSQRTHASSAGADAGEYDAASAADMPHITRARTNAMETAPAQIRRSRHG